MTETADSERRPNPATDFALYAAKATLAFGTVFAVGAFAEIAPPLVLGILWALLACATTVSAAYPYVIRRMNTAGMYQPGSFMHNRVDGRFLIITANFVVSATLMASLVLDMQRWTGREWLVAAGSIPLYALVSALMAKLSATQYRDEYRERSRMLGSLWASAAIIACFYLAITFWIPAGSHESLGDAFASTRQLFAASPTDLVSEAGKWEYVVECLTLFGLDQLAKAPFVICLTVNLVSCVLTAFAMAHVLTLCSLSVAQVRQVFLPLGHADDASVNWDAIAKRTALLIVLGAILACSFLYANGKVSELRQSEFYASVEDGVRAQTNLTAYRVDGRNFAAVTVEEAVASAVEGDEAAMKAREALLAAVNESYDACEDKVDAYLDWYFNPLTGIERFMSLFGDSAGAQLREEYLERVGSPLEDEALASLFDAYNAAKGSLRTQVEDDLAGTFRYGIPDWMVASQRSVDEFPQFQQSVELLELSEPEGEYLGFGADRDEYRQAIVAAIEKSRSQAIEAIG